MENLRPVDKVEILILVDNYVDLLLPGNEHVQRPPLAKEGKIFRETLIAEHGLSLLVTVHTAGESHGVLLDTGANLFSVRHNLKVLGLNLDHLDAIVISHGHSDHTGGLEATLEDFPAPVKVFLHPTAFVRRHIDLPSGERMTFPLMMQRNEMEQRSVEVTESVGPSLIAGNTVLVTGQIPRVTGFETGLPGALMEVEGGLQPDPMHDDQSIVVSLGDKGLVVISGCAHSGIINSVLYAREVTGQSRIHTVMGGFHLTGPAMDPLIEPTVAEMKKLAPHVIVPIHCTGFAATNRFAQEFPSAFVLSSVGSKIVCSR